MDVKLINVPTYKTMLYKLINDLDCSIDEPAKSSLVNFLIALSSVNKSYIKYDGKIEGQSRLVPHLERVFAYELYRQWQNLLERQQFDLCLNAEPHKYRKILEIDCDKEHAYVMPDLVLHHSQEDIQKQLAVCEIKRWVANMQKEDIRKFANDMNRLVDWTTPNKDCQSARNPFDFGIFIIVGNIFEGIDQFITELLCKIDVKDNANVFIVLYDGNQICIQSIYKLKKSNY